MTGDAPLPVLEVQLDFFAEGVASAVDANDDNAGPSLCDGADHPSGEPEDPPPEQSPNDDADQPQGELEDAPPGEADGAPPDQAADREPLSDDVAEGSPAEVLAEAESLDRSAGEDGLLDQVLTTGAEGVASVPDTDGNAEARDDEPADNAPAVPERFIDDPADAVLNEISDPEEPAPAAAEDGAEAGGETEELPAAPLDGGLDDGAAALVDAMDRSEEPRPDDTAEAVAEAVDGSDECDSDESAANDEHDALHLADVLDGPAAEIAEEMNRDDAAQGQHDEGGPETEHIEIDGEEEQQAQEEEEGGYCAGDPMEERVDYVVATGRPPAPEEWEEVLTYARRKEIDALLVDDYDNARRYKRTEDVIRQAIQENESRPDRKSWQDSIDARIAHLNRRIKEATTEWDDRISQLEADSADRRSAMESRHAQDNAEFEEEWGSENFLLTFSKASPALLQLRQIQRNQALSKDFDGALKTKAIADQRQEMEEDASQLRAIRAMRIAYSQMKARHAKEVQLSDEHTNIQYSKLEDMKARDIGTLKRAIQQLEARKERPRPRLIAPTIVGPRATTSVSNRPASPETRKSLYAYRTSKEHQAKLRLPGFDVNEHLHPAKPQTQPFRPRTTRRFRGYRY
jgi:hypothetical protein